MFKIEEIWYIKPIRLLIEKILCSMTHYYILFLFIHNFQNFLIKQMNLHKLVAGIVCAVSAVK